MACHSKQVVVEKKRTETRKEKERNNEYDILIRDCIARYLKYGRLIDEETKTVTQKSINKFKNLFEENAEVINDLSSENNLISITEYIAKVFFYLKDRGVETGLSAESYKFLTKRSTVYRTEEDEVKIAQGYKRYIIVLEKILFNSLDSNNEVVEHPEGRAIELELVLYVSLKKQEAKIARIFKKGESS